MHTITTRLTASAIALFAGVTLAPAQTARDHDSHHPDTQAKPANPMAGPSGKQTGPGMGMGNMMGGNMEQMMPMMQMMRTMHMMGGMMSHDGGGMAMMPGSHIEGRIAFLKAELAITDAQVPQWNAFADAMRDGAKSMQAAMTANMDTGMPATAPARTDAMIAMMSARLDAMKATAAASKALYAVLTDAQKKSADELMTPPMGGMGRRQ